MLSFVNLANNTSVITVYDYHSVTIIVMCVIDTSRKTFQLRTETNPLPPASYIIIKDTVHESTHVSSEQSQNFTFLLNWWGQFDAQYCYIIVITSTTLTASNDHKLPCMPTNAPDFASVAKHILLIALCHSQKLAPVEHLIGTQRTDRKQFARGVLFTNTRSTCLFIYSVTQRYMTQSTTRPIACNISRSWGMLCIEFSLSLCHVWSYPAL